MIEHEGRKYELVGNCDYTPCKYDRGDLCVAEGTIVLDGNCYIRIPETPQEVAGNESDCATTYPTIELRGVETGNGISEQLRKVREEVSEQSGAYIAEVSSEDLIDETWDVIRSNITLLGIIAKKTGIPITVGRDRHLAKMDSRGWKERKKEGE